MATQSYDAAPQSSAIVSLALSVSSVMAFSAAPISAAVVGINLTGATASLKAAPVSYCAATATLTGSTATLRAYPISEFAARFALIGSTLSISAAPIASFSATIAITGATADVKAAPSSAWNGNALLTGSTATISASAVSSFFTSADLTGGSDPHGMSFCDVVDEALAMWGIFCRKSAPVFAIDRATNDINTALQLVWNNAEGRSYWSNDTITVTLADGVSSLDLADDIQNVIGPCRREDNRQPLVPIGTIGELETFADLFLDGESTTEPLAYHIERMNQSGNDPAKCVFHVTPAVSGSSVSFLLEVIKEAPRFSAIDLANCPVIPIPHRYVESLLLPIVRYHASSFYLFRQPEQKETIDREYQRASISLGLADPLPGKSGDNSDRKEASK